MTGQRNPWTLPGAILVGALLAGGARAADAAHLSRNEAIELTVSAVRTADRYGPLRPPTDRKFLVVSTEWRNLLASSVIDGKLTATPYLVPALDGQLFLIAGGRVVPFAAVQNRPGVLPVKDFTVADPASPVRGNLVFEVPTDAADLLLVFVDERYGPMSVRLAGETAAPPATGSRPATNELLEAFVRGQRTIEDKTAPAESETIGVDVRLRSIFQPDRNAKCAKLVALPDWPGRYVQALVDGAYATSPLSGPFGGTAATILPEAATGGELVFRVPRRRASMDLVLYFAEMPTAAGNVRPRPIHLPLKVDGGAAPVPRPRDPIVSTRDGIFDVAIVEAATARAFAGATPAADRKFLAVDAIVTNVGRRPEIFQGPEQLKHVGEAGEATAADPATYAGPRPPLAQLYIPAGERRSFQMVFAIPAAESRSRIAYASPIPGGSRVLELPLPASAAIAAAGVPPPNPNPNPAPNPPPGPVTPVPAGTSASSAAPAKAPSPGEKAATPPREPKGLAGVGLTAEQVNQAIDRGADFLWRLILERDIRGNPHALGYEPEHYVACLALVHAGAHRRHADFDVALRRFLSTTDPLHLDAYRAGIVCMLVEAFGDPSFLPQLEAVSQYLLELQGEKGSWNYRRPLPPDFFQSAADERVLMVSGGRPPEDDTTPAHARRTDWKEGIDGDNSTSQYALLGLHAASRSGLRVDAEVWRRGLDSYLERQGTDGNWSYHGQSSSGYGSMTSAGICAVALSLHELGEKDIGNHPATARGLDWLARNFSLEVNPGLSASDQWRYYYLYSVERVGRVLGVEFIGPYEWYPLGARLLLDSQTAEGGWVGQREEVNPRLATSFALLFLTRATASLQPLATAVNGDGTLKTGILLPKGSRYYFILDASGSMTAPMEGRSKWEIARDAVASLVEELPEHAEVALRVYGHRRRAIEAGASEDTALEVPLRRLVKKDMLAKIAALRPRGKTPIARSLIEAKRDLASASEQSPVTVVLLTDGGEDTLPRQDPVAAAAELAGLKGIRFHIVGFDIGREDWRAQLEAMALKGEGRYWPAADGTSLRGELRSAVFGVPAGFSVTDEKGSDAGSGRFGDTLTLGPGGYLFHAGYAGVEYEQSFRINSGEATSVVFNAAQVARLRLPPGTASSEAPAATPTRPAASPGKPRAPAPDARPRFCTACGKPLGPNARFCTSCGKKVGE